MIKRKIKSIYRRAKESALTRVELLEANLKLKRNSRPSVAILYKVPLSSNKYSSWRDGFTAAIEELSDNYDVYWINTAAVRPKRSTLEAMDFVLVKANWGWGPDQLLRKNYPDLSTKKGLMISGVSDPPVLSEMEYYDVLYYETGWYKPKISNHSKTIHAFGVDTRVMKPLEEEVTYDVISVGKFRKYKRYHKLLSKNGRAIAIGDIRSSERSIIEKLRGGGVEVRGFVDYEELARLLNMSKLCYIPARLDGGGERAVLESRACGTPVEVEDDNPKLKELLDVPVWDHVYYSEQLEKGF